MFVNLGIKKLGDINYLIFDELLLEANFDVEISREVLLANFASFTVTREGSKRTQPIFSSIGITPNEYEDFWHWCGLEADKWLDWLNNDLFATGVPLPYWHLSLLTAMTFHPHALILVGSVFYNK
jgi:hypothetical protein